MIALCMTPVRASVRTIGAIGPYVARNFDLMLCHQDDNTRQTREAKRILAQVGYEYRGVIVGSPFNDAESQP